jgi:hypothetical protein
MFQVTILVLRNVFMFCELAIFEIIDNAVFELYATWSWIIPKWTQNKFARLLVVLQRTVSSCFGQETRGRTHIPIMCSLLTIRENTCTWQQPGNLLLQSPSATNCRTTFPSLPPSKFFDACPATISHRPERLCVLVITPASSLEGPRFDCQPRDPLSWERLCDVHYLLQKNADILL